jgi:hypothetical protein
MMTTPFAHTFHIPVMGIGFTIDTPIKVAPYGISSVISLVDDMLMEKMREFYCKKWDMPFQEISKKMEDFRARRITAYLNLVNELVERKFEELKNAVPGRDGAELEKYLKMLPTALQEQFQLVMEENGARADKAWEWLKSNFSPGSIDVNIMTKLDKDNYLEDEKLPVEYNDAHAALRGFANSKLQSSIVLSAGMNPRLYSYFEQFEDFFPDALGRLKKKIILKVSDYRSALIQGKFLAKKGLWISEYRIESGLNCGGHAFATDGYLMGPILEEFRQQREALVTTVHDIFIQALKSQDRPQPARPLPLKITAQGGVGTAAEHQFLLDHYQLDSVGWGTPFLLVPEAVSIDDTTRELLGRAREKDLYLSNASPLGVPFNNVRGNTKDFEKFEHIRKDRPGSACPKKYASLNTEFTEKVICTASRQYQHLKLKELEEKELDQLAYQQQYEDIVEKSCICVGLGTAALLANGLDTKTEGEGVSVCPGPNMAYFSDTVSLREMADHIYGRLNIIKRNDRPFFLIKELSMYVDYYQKKVAALTEPYTAKQIKYLAEFRKNLNEGIAYYKDLFRQADVHTGCQPGDLLQELESFAQKLNREENHLCLSGK